MILYTTNVFGAKFTRVTQLHEGTYFSTLFSYERTVDDILHYASVVSGLTMYPFNMATNEYFHEPPENVRKFTKEELAS